MATVLVVLIFFSVPLSCSTPADSCADVPGAIPPARTHAASAGNAAFAIHIFMCVVLWWREHGMARESPAVAPVASPAGLRSGAGRRHPLVGIDLGLRLGFRLELVFPLGGDRGRNTVADDVGRRPAHVEELV